MIKYSRHVARRKVCKCSMAYCGSSSEGLDSRSNNIDSDVKALSSQLAQYLLSHDLFG